MTRIHPALVTDIDIKIAVDYTAKNKNYPLKVADLPFVVPAEGPTSCVSPHDHGAVGVTLTHGESGSPDYARLLPVLSAIGRTQREEQHHETWMPTGVVMLAGEIAARYLHRQLAREHSTKVLTPLTQAINVVWPQRYAHLHPGQHPLGGPTRCTKWPPPCPHPLRHPAGQLMRLANGPHRAGFTPAETKAMRLIARTLPGERLTTRMRCAARLCTVFVPRYSRYRVEDLNAVREEIISFRANRRRADEEPPRAAR
ncbi:hypothetical protein [Streptomyces goshikiensis]|uniref:hypothetical protein n=1 Tax=Streptomyces goshikiensis TaxID=1942 RepID=UPI0036CFD078